MSIALLRTFITAVEAGSLTEAGRRVGRSQPAVTQQIQRLERLVGRPLFGPDKRTMTLTAEGEILLQDARGLLRMADRTLARFRTPEVAGRVVLGTPDLYAAHLLPDMLARFARAYPAVEVELRCRRSVFLQDALSRAELDVALLTRQPGMEGTVVRREPLVWVAGSDTSLEDQTTLPLALLPEGSVYRARALEALGEAGRAWRVVAVSDSIAGLQASIFSGLAVGVFPHCAVAPGMRLAGGGQGNGLPPLPSVDLVLLCRKSSPPEAAIRLADFMTAELATVRPYRPPRRGA